MEEDINFKAKKDKNIMQNYQNNNFLMIQDGQSPEGLEHQVNQDNHQTSLAIKIMIGYLYFAQGFVLSISGTVTFIYPQLPDYFTLSLFSLSFLPFSFKFMTAPILQKYSYLGYGKRKTWIVLSQLLTNLMIFVCAFFTKLEQAKTFAFLTIFMYLGLSLQDISLDALCLKQLKSPKMMSMIQGSCQSSGVIIGSLVLLKGTSLQFAKSIGLDSPISNLKQILIVLSILMLIPTLLIHFKFKQLFSHHEEKTMGYSIFKVYSIYRCFFQIGYRYCYVLIFSLFSHQGFNFFSAGYQYQLINAGFSRNTLNTIDNFQSIILTALMFILGTKSNHFGYKRSFMIQLMLNWSLLLYIWFFFPTKVVPIVIISFILGFLSQWNFLLSTILCGDFPEHGVTGMIYTMSASSSNLGRNKFIHTAILKIVPWRTMAIIGLGLQLILILVFTPKMIDLIQTGQTKIHIDKDRPKSQTNIELQEVGQINQ